MSIGIRRAVILVSSQKSFTVTLALLAQLSDILGPSIGLAAIPCVLVHLSQIFLDSLLVSHWLKADT